MAPLQRQFRCKKCGGELTHRAWVTDHRTGKRRYAKWYGKRSFVWCDRCDA